MARERKRAWFGGESQQNDPLDTSDGSPVDIASIRHDDALIDAIASDGPVATDSPDEYELATLLANWRAEIVTPELPAGPDFEEIVTAVNQEIGARQARVSAGSRLRLVRPIAGAAAAVALIVGGMTAFSYNANPGDPLWKVKQVVFSQQAASTMANSDSTSDLQQAERLISAGDLQAARTHLEHASQRAGAVDDTAQRSQLEDWMNRLKSEVDKVLPPAAASTAAPTVPGSPDASASPKSPLPTSPAASPPSGTWNGNTPPADNGNGGPTVDRRTATLQGPVATSTIAQEPPVVTSAKPDTSAMMAPPPATQPTSTARATTPELPTVPESELPITKTADTPTR